MTSILLEDVDGRRPDTLVETTGYASTMCADALEERRRFGAFLRAELEQQHISVAELSRRTGLRYSVIQRWLDPILERRLLPSTKNCHVLADALGLDELAVLRAAGHLRGGAVSDQPPPPYWEELRAIFRREKRAMRNIPASRWPFFRAMLEADVARMQTAVERFEEIVQAEKLIPPDGR